MEPAAKKVKLSVRCDDLELEEELEDGEIVESGDEGSQSALDDLVLVGPGSDSGGKRPLTNAPGSSLTQSSVDENSSCDDTESDGADDTEDDGQLPSDDSDSNQNMADSSTEDLNTDSDLDLDNNLDLCPDPTQVNSHGNDTPIKKDSIDSSLEKYSESDLESYSNVLPFVDAQLAVSNDVLAPVITPGSGPVAVPGAVPGLGSDSSNDRVDLELVNEPTMAVDVNIISKSRKSDKGDVIIQNEKGNHVSNARPEAEAQADLDVDIDAWLDEGLDANDTEQQQQQSRPDDDDNIGRERERQNTNTNSPGKWDWSGQGHEPVQRDKLVFVEKGPSDPFDVLPVGWIKITHDCGMPIYLHKETRVCNLARPYFIGPASARRHDMPLNAIPCLHYKKSIEFEKEQQEKEQKELELEKDQPQGQSSALSAIISENVQMKVETSEEISKRASLSLEDLKEYCSHLFEFKTITVKRFASWKERRQHYKEKRKSERPKLPDNMHLLTCSLPKNAEFKDKSQTKKEFVLNPKGKSGICILHEYFQHTMKAQPQYVYKELESGATPYQASIVINGIEYGSGFGASKKHAKNEAAKNALEILLPGAKKLLEGDEDKADSSLQGPDISFFSNLKIEDPRISQLSMKAGQPTPFEILTECLQRNFGLANDTNIKFEATALKKQRSQYTMSVGDHSATVVSKNKRDGKQLAAQAIIQKLHPYLDNWGSVLQLYGNLNSLLRKKHREQAQVTGLYKTVEKNKLDTAVLSSLKDSMKKISTSKDGIPSKNKLLLNLTTTSMPLISTDNKKMRKPNS